MEGCQTDDVTYLSLSIMSYNMHGYNQGLHALRDLTLSATPDIIMLQEHWLTPANLCLFDNDFPQYLCYGSSAMCSAVEAGVLRGRPFGGVMTIVNKKLKDYTEIICASERYVIVAVGDLLVINVYFPCTGTNNRLFILEEIIEDLKSWMFKHPHRRIVLGGDFNTVINQENPDPVCKLLHCFMVECNLYSCDMMFDTKGQQSTYYNEALNCESVIDYFLVNDVDLVTQFAILDPYINFSDHRPITINCMCCVYKCRDRVNCRDSISTKSEVSISQLRWDRADLAAYRSLTGYYLQSLNTDLTELEKTSGNRFASKSTLEKIDDIYCRIVNLLLSSSDSTVPSYRKNFFKFWWDYDLDELKQKSIASCRTWRAAGKPRSGPIFELYRKDKSAYRNGIRSRQRDEKLFYTNDLHEALLKKQGTTFWKCWNSKFGTDKRAVNHVDGITDPEIIAQHFMSHFSKVCANTTVSGATRLKNRYDSMRSNYCGQPFTEHYLFDTELVERVITNMKRGKAPDLDRLTSEHLQYSHALLPVVLSKLFNLMMHNGYVPCKFGQSYTVPIPKSSCNLYSKSITVDDFRGISISPVISKVFEHCILDRYSKFFLTSDNQFGFKKESGCSHALYTLKCVVDYYASFGSTVNLCALDISKAFDRMNHHGLFVKLMNRRIPTNLLLVLENWFQLGVTCVKWCNVVSDFFELTCGIRQGGVLSPYLFAVYIDSVVDRVKSYGLGCYIKAMCVSVFLYADDILLLAPSLSCLQQLLYICEDELQWLDLTINARKSACIRIGPRFNVRCSNITTINGHELTWYDEIRYLGVYVIAARYYRCSHSNAKRSFYRAFNAMFGKIGRCASEEVIIELLKMKCLPVLLYGLESCPFNKTQIKSLDFAISSAFSKIFCTKSQDIIDTCRTLFNCQPVADSLCTRKRNFLCKYVKSSNVICRLFVNDANEECAKLPRQ